MKYKEIDQIKKKKKKTHKKKNTHHKNVAVELLKNIS